MTIQLPELHEGHAPITLHELFRDALEAYDDWDRGEDVPLVSYQGQPVSIATVFLHMRDCTDILPNNLVGAIKERLTKPLSSASPLEEIPFSTAARVMNIMVRKRYRDESGDLSALLGRITDYGSRQLPQ